MKDLTAFSEVVPIAISAISLALSIVEFILNYRLHKRDEEQGAELRRLQAHLSELQLEREEEEARMRASSKVEARHVLMGAKSHRIRVSNTGGTTVTDITCSCEGGPYYFRQDKEPYERLEPGESFDEVVTFVGGSPSKFHITTRWIDADGAERSRDNIISV
ncbi:MAG: hypothetical protein SOZ36_09615 [Atopobiaceae bacterium]|nr:hypothetical protein [Atopobiaceae bacterium]